jgi:hypothetical protein
MKRRALLIKVMPDMFQSVKWAESTIVGDHEQRTRRFGHRLPKRTLAARGRGCAKRHTTFGAFQ